MNSAPLTILQLLERTAAYFSDRGVPNPRLDAELLLSDLLRMKRIDLYLQFDKTLSESNLVRFRSAVQRRGKREPLQYIIGHTEFFGRRFMVTPDVLIPRPETEQLVARALEWLDAHPDATRILDFGTGSGCIAITMALERPQLLVTAMDVSNAALAVAQRNVAQLTTGGAGHTATGPAAGHAPHPSASPSALTGTIETRGSDCWRGRGPRPASPVDTYDLVDAYDLIISNPPYIPSAEIAALQSEVAQHEPRLALDGGEDGLAFYRQLLQDAPSQLNPGGVLIVEIGLGQQAAISDIAEACGPWKAPVAFNDLSGMERILLIELKDSHGRTSN